MNENYDVVVVGGGAAGLSGAVALARSRRSVLVVDADRYSAYILKGALMADTARCSRIG